MQLIRDLQAGQREKTTVCMGVFDGLHLGHQALIEMTKCIAKETSTQSGLLSFEPYPQAFFARKEKQPMLPRLMRLRDKYQCLIQWELDAFFALRFNAALAGLSGVEFVRQVLVDGINVAAVVVGDDFRFGKGRDSGVDELAVFAKEYGFSLQVVPAVLTRDGKRCSSSAIRDYLTKDSFQQLEEMLGRSYSVSGCVRAGDGRGRQIGVPTANVQVPSNALPLDGVYVVEAIRPGGQRLQGVANIGRQPTFLGEKKRLEVHAFDFDESAYGEYWKVIIRGKIRGVKKFGGIDELISRIKQDIADGKRFFS
jgi:riboflavin kinase / FMN adenylyltransferase